MIRLRVPGANGMGRLTVREYTNTLSDLMLGQVTTAELQLELGWSFAGSFSLNKSSLVSLFVLWNEGAV